MVVEAKIISQDNDSNVCVVEIKDNGEIVSYGNIGLQTNPDGTANTIWLTNTVKEIVLSRRRETAEQSSINKLTSTINSSNSEE